MVYRSTSTTFVHKKKQRKTIMSNKESKVSNIYKLDGRVLVAKAIPFGLIFIFFLLATGKAKKVTPLMYVLAVLFVLKYVFL